MVIFTIPAKEKRQRLKEIRQSKKSGKVSGPGIMKESIITVALQSGNVKKHDDTWRIGLQAVLKKLNVELPTLHLDTAPREHEELIIYLAAAKEALISLSR
ncbi:hypothetical protein Tco_0257064 [Tanacetum coccineum]